MLTRLRTVLHHLNRAAMSTTVHNTNQACCTIPPVLSDYSPKGSFQSYAGISKVRRLLLRTLQGTDRPARRSPPGLHHRLR